jgi:hypothetical protein
VEQPLSEMILMSGTGAVLAQALCFSSSCCGGIGSCAAKAAAGLEVAATAGSVDAEVAAGSELAGAAAAGSVVGGPAAFPGVRAACAKCHDLTARPHRGRCYWA